jgi:hypothetical protein
MTESKVPRPAGRAARLVLGLLFVSLLTIGTVAKSPAHGQTTATNPPLAQLEIDIWPEFDRESSVLVILRAEVAPEVSLPAQVSMRLPASSGGPTALATAVSATSQLLTLDYTRSDVQVDFMTIAFSTPNRFFHVEFYEPVPTVTAERSYSYVWTGDFAVAQTIVQLQEPAGSSGTTVTPDLGIAEVRADQLAYREADLGPLEAGQPLTVDVQYTKPGTRTSADILGLQQTPSEQESGGDDPAWQSDTALIIAGAVAVAVLAGCGVYVWQRVVLAGGGRFPATRVQRRRAAGTAGKVHCSQCGSALSKGAKFCASCGHPVKGRD